MKILIVRFSSFGDVLQCLSVAGALTLRFPDAEIHWVTRDEFVPLVKTHPAINKVWSIGGKRDTAALLKLALELRAARFTHVYDAHNNLRSRVIGWVVRAPFRFASVKFLRRSIFRFRRFLLFRFRINLFPQPFSGQQALLEPLRKWDVPAIAPTPQLWLSPHVRQVVLKNYPFLQKPFIALAPSAAFELKRWPAENWKELIRSSPMQFVLLGGPKDGFLADFVEVAPGRVLNLAGRLSLEESAAVVEASQALISNDTGLMHVAEQIGKPCIALMGPAPFGYPSRKLTTILETKLSCRPCSKHGQGPCVNSVYQKCLRDIQPDRVLSELRRLKL
jgi:lipopolysaccharide heptosyltransferase II